MLPSGLLIALEFFHFLLGQVSPLTRLKIPKTQGPDPDADDTNYGQPQLLADLPDLTFSSLPHRHADPRTDANALDEHAIELVDDAPGAGALDLHLGASITPPVAADKA